MSCNNSPIIEYRAILVFDLKKKKKKLEWDEGATDGSLDSPVLADHMVGIGTR